MKRIWLMPMFLVGCSAQVTVDPNETSPIVPPPVAEFDPANKIIPFPNNLVLDPATGKLNLPPQCGETETSTAIRQKGLNVLDGFGTSRTVIQATFSEPVDLTSVKGNLFLLRMSTAGVPVDPSESEVEIVYDRGKTIRFDPACSKPSQIDNLTVSPVTPLEGKSTYAVVLLTGIKGASGAEFSPTATWGLVRQGEEPVTLVGSGTSLVVSKNDTPFDPTVSADLASIQGVDQLWKAHAPALRFLDDALPPRTLGPIPRSRILLAWQFSTETISDPFDASRAGSPASLLTTASEPDTGIFALPNEGDVAVKNFYETNAGAGSCDKLGCATIGAIYGGILNAVEFQARGAPACAATTVPGAWSDPLAPKQQCTEGLQFLAVVPKMPPGPNGYKTVIYGHGITRTKGDLLALAGSLAAAGIASISIDAVNHGSRAVQISTDAAIGCAKPMEGNKCEKALDASCATQCYAPILSPDLSTTRDNLRQTVLDNLKLERLVKSCAQKGSCKELWVDADHIGFVGQSLGSIIGSVTVAVSPSIKTAVLDVGAADWVQIFSFTKTDGLRCTLIDALIDALVLRGQKWKLGANKTALCLDPGRAWAKDPGFLQFAAITRWMLDPVDGMNYSATYRSSRNVLLQEVMGDEVVPNEATKPFGELLGLTSSAAAEASHDHLAPSDATSRAGSAWIQYKKLDPDPARAFPGNTYSHGSMLAPATDGPDGLLGTAQMQTDVVTYLDHNL
jgi:hypothetical protein